MFKLNYKELFVELDFEEQYPIEIFASVIPKHIGTTRDVIHLDFSGIDRLSDEVFFVLKQELKITQKQNVEVINLTGCCHVTDRGIEILSQSFSNLKELILIGCSQITQLSLHFLLENCPKLDNLSAQFTNISYISNAVENRWGKTNIISNELFNENEDQKNLPVNLVILVMDDTIECDIGHYLVTGKIKNRDHDQPIIYQPHALTIDETSINVIQLFCPTVYMAPFICDRSLFIIATDLESETSNAFNIIKGLDFIRGVVYCCPIQILTFTSSSETHKLDELSHVLQSIFTDQQVNMKEHVDQEHYSKSSSKDFIDQWRYVQSLSAIDPEHISLYLLGLNKTNESCQLCYCTTICEPSTSAKIEETISDFSEHFVNVKDSLDRINKFDINEIKSLNRLSEGLEKIILCIIKIFNKQQTVKEFLNDPLLLSPLREYKALTDDDHPEESLNLLKENFGSKEELETNSRGIKLSTALGQWLLAKWNLCEKLAPLKKKLKDFELLSKTRAEVKTTFELISLNMRQNFIQMSKYMYQHLPSKSTNAISLVTKAIEKHKFPILTTKDINMDVHQLNRKDLCLVLEQIQTTGRIISLPSIGLVIINVEWFVNAINMLLTKWNSPLNDNRVWFITSQAVLSTRDELASVIASICDHELFQKMLLILQYYGLIISVNRSWNVEPQHWEPLSFTENDHKILYTSWHQLSNKPDSNVHLVINKPDIKSNPSTRILNEIFPNYNTPEFIKDDISLKFSFKFRIGIPSNLFAKVVSKLSIYFRTVLIWSQGILVREGAVEVLVIHNIHASRGSSSFDIDTRILGPVNGRRPVAVREHSWNILSEIITVIEAAIIEYPHLHHKIRHYCRGQCFKDLDQENTFAEAQVNRSLNCNYNCTKCRDYQMNQSDWLYILGRQIILPNHEYEKLNNVSCKSCWKRKSSMEFLWKSQQKIFPTFASKVFYSKNDKNIRGNLIISGSEDSSVRSRMKCRANYLQQCDINIFDPTKSKIILFEKIGSSEVEIFSWDIENGDITTSLKQENHDNHSEDAAHKYPLKIGDYIGISFSKEENEAHTMVITKNNNMMAKYSLLAHSSVFLSFKVTPDETGSEKIKLIISNTNASVVTAHHFRPGMIVLLKGETKWEPALIVEITKGKLNCQPLNSIDMNASIIRPSNNQLLAPNSTNILPPGFYPSEINSTLDSKNQKSLAESWYKILKEYSEYSACPFGLFPRLQDKPSYLPLPIFGDESRECITSYFSPSRILRLMYFNKPLSSRTLTSYLPLPHPLTPSQLLMPQRQIISHNLNHALHRLCPGNLWRNYNRDMHPMNETPYQMKEGEAKYFFQGDFFLDVFIIIKNFTTSFSAVYQNIDQCFPLIDPHVDKNLLRDAIVSISKAYRDILLFDIVAKIDMYNKTIMTMDKTVNTIISSKQKSMKRNKKKSMVQLPLAPKSVTVKTDKLSSNEWTEDDIESIQEMLQKKDLGCESHKLSSKVMQMANLGPYCECIANIMIKHVDMNNVKETALVSVTKLRKLEIDMGTMLNISWLTYLPKLTSLTLSNCGLKEIGREIEQLKSSLNQLCLDGNPIEELPNYICDFASINSLELNNTLLAKLPADIGNLKFLKYLSIDHTKLSSLPESFSKLKNLVTLKISGVPPPIFLSKNATISLKDWTSFSHKTQTNGFIFQEKDIFNSFDTFAGTEGLLHTTKFEEFQNYLFENIPRIKSFPVEILSCTSLQALIIPYQAFENIPDDIKNLVNLKKFVIDGCKNLQTISSYVGTLPLEVLGCQNCDNLKTPPYEIRRQGMRNTIAYLLRLVSGSEACYRTKLMLVGLGGAGKTSLMRALTNKNFCAPQIAEEAITDGIDINSWAAKQSKDITLQFSIWDFAGQTLYYNTHQFFLTGRAIYLLIWNVRQGFEHAGLDFWLNSICCHAPLAPIFIIGTHSDKVDKSEIPTTLFQSRYPSVVGFFFISSLTGKGVKELHDRIIEETMKQSYIGEIVPNAWIRFEKDLISQRNTVDYLRWDAVKKLANNNAIYDGEIHQAVRFLHDLGSIQYFELPLLQDFVIINSQWLVDVMACVVSVKNTIIENGKLEHSKIKLVWSKYPETIHKWLLRLTEIFDLTFSVPGQDFNLVPCLLPNEVPDFQWTDYVDFNSIRESNMYYQFEYLPPGLFNRAQVRLSQFSDSFVIWQHGSLLNKNEDKALMTKLNDTTVKVCARGFWPDNILFIIHEMFETLINEAFSGVNYEYQLSCKKCVAERDSEPYLFNKNILQRAIQSKTVFIQCHRNFHIITMTEIQESTPPDSIEDYDLQFKKSVYFISSSHEKIDTPIVVLVSDIDYNNDSSLLNTPKRIIKDLGKNQYSVWCEPLIEGTSEDQYIEVITRAAAVVSVVSGNFMNNKLCMTLFRLAKITLRKHMVLVLIDKKYTDGALGLETAGDKYINFERANVYDQKFKELLHDIKIPNEEDNSQVAQVQKPRVFLSYCWENSQRSFDGGNSKNLNKDAIGWGDPRDIKDYIEQKGINCWLDVEMIGSNSLYSEITSGLRNSEVVVACLSSEYAKSDLCKKEFVFAKQNLNLPIVIAEVGLNYDWLKTEIGLLSIEYPKINFQTENPGAFEEVFNLVNSKLASTPKSTSNDDVTKLNKMACQEDFELIQRKIFRLLSSGFGSEESRMYPRLFFIDIMDDPEENVKITEKLNGSPLPEIPASVNSNFSKYSLCFKILCESESGWHTVDEGLPINLSNSEQERLLVLGAPYLYRITLLLTFSEGENIQLFSSKTKKSLNKLFMEVLENNSKSWSYMKPIHNAMRSHIMAKDENLNYGGLLSCCLNNGKVVWLCSEHRRRPHISVISSEESSSLIKLDRKRTQKDIDDSNLYEQQESIRDSVLIDKMEEIIKEHFSDGDSSTDSRKGGNETNKFLQMVSTNTPVTIKPERETLKRSKTSIPDRKPISSLEVVNYPLAFQSRTCSMM